jgi:cytochrome c553
LVVKRTSDIDVAYCSGASAMRLRVAVFNLILLLLVACGAGGAATGNPASGKQLFNGAVSVADTGAPACATCHAIEPGMDTGSGQSLAGIGDRAATAVAGQSAEEYLRTSIMNPDAFLSGGYQEGIMYRGYAQALTSQQVDDLVAYLLTLKSGQGSEHRLIEPPARS